MKSNFSIRTASSADVKLILQFIRELAEYEKMADEVTATEELLSEWLFEKKSATVLIGESEGIPIGFALYFYNFSTFLGKAGIYLEDLYIRDEYRHRGFGTEFMKALARIATENNCGRLEWWCLDWNQPGIDFYLSLGARPMKDWTVYRITGQSLAELANKSDS